MKNFLKKNKMWATAIAIIILPNPLVILFLRLLGHCIHSSAKFGFSFIFVENLFLGNNARVGHLNFIRVRRLVMRPDSVVGRGNVMNGPISVLLSNRSAIGNDNKIMRGPLGLVASGSARLYLGELTKITAKHRIDCTASIYVGDFSIIAGTACELWTHGYVHDFIGPGRYRIDGSITIGDNVYIGSSSIITPGVTVANGVIVGAGTTVARSIVEPGLYVSAGLRKLARPENPDRRQDLRVVNDSRLCERVYVKNKIPFRDA